VRYIRWYHDEEDLRVYEELDEGRWSTRHIEVRGSDGTFVAAAALVEVQAAIESGDPWAVNAYERRYGILPEADFPIEAAADEPPIEASTAEEFERLWQQARSFLAARPPRRFI
jgi:hypothetical protein